MKTNMTMNAESENRNVIAGNAFESVMTMMALTASAVGRIAVRMAAWREVMATWRKVMVRRTMRYYSREVERQLTRTQTLCIVRAQIAFVAMLVLSSGPLWLVAVSVVMFALSLLRCREELSK